MEINIIDLEGVILKNLNCVKEELVSKEEAFKEIIDFVKSNFIAFNNLGLGMSLGELEKLKKQGGFEITTRGNAICLSKEIEIFKRGGEKGGVQ